MKQTPVCAVSLYAGSYNLAVSDEFPLHGELPSQILEIGNGGVDLWALQRSKKPCCRPMIESNSVLGFIHALHGLLCTPQRCG